MRPGVEWCCFYFAARRWAISATCLPWKRAWASSLALGWREPSAPAIVPAPRGLPPFTSVMSVSSGQEYGRPT